MKQFKGKNAIWFVMSFLIYNLLPLLLIGKELNISNKFVIITLLILYYCGNLIVLPFMLRNRVELFDDYFMFYYGFGKQKIYIKDIKEIKKSHNPIASSANSFDRIYVATNQTELYISLRKNDEFIQMIKDKISQ